MTTTLLRGCFFGALLASACSTAALAGEVGELTQFKPNTKANAADVNKNFADVKAAVNDNNQRLNSLDSNLGVVESAVNTNSQRLTSLERPCPPDMVENGASCIDKYESSVWGTVDAALIAKIKSGVATTAELATATVKRYGDNLDDYGTDCPDDARGCKTVYAVSVAGVAPSRFINWFQAAAACRNSGKRLPTDQEWLMAAFGTPDPGNEQTNNCNVASGAVANTGSRGFCVSDVSAFDMVGNLYEWVAEWKQPGTPGWNAATNRSNPAWGGDNANGINASVFNGAGEFFPAGVYRGGGYSAGTGAGVFALDAWAPPSLAQSDVGFRCAK